MKLLEDHRHFFLPLQLPIVVIGILLALFFQTQVIKSLSGYWLLWVFVAYFAFHPISRERIPVISPLTSTLLPCLGFTVALWFNFLGITYLVTQGIPVNVPALHGSTLPSLITESNQWGFYPWPLYALFSMAMSYYGYVLGDTKRVQSTIRPLFQTRLHDAISLSVDFVFRSHAALPLLLLMTFFILGLAQVFASIPLYTGLRVGFFFLMAYSLSPLPQQQLFKILQKLPSMPRFFFLLAPLAVTVIALEILNQAVHYWPASFPISPTVSHWLHLDQDRVGWSCFTFLWWSLWLPLYTGQVIYHSGGRSLRGVLGITLLNLLLIQGLNGWLTLFSPSSTVILTGFFLSSLYFLVWMTHTQVIHGLILGIFPGEPYKTRSPGPYYRFFTQNSASLTGLYLMVGLSLLSWIFWVLSLSFFSLFWFTLISFCLSALHYSKGTLHDSRMGKDPPSAE